MLGVAVHAYADERVHRVARGERLVDAAPGRTASAVEEESTVSYTEPSAESGHHVQLSGERVERWCGAERGDVIDDVRARDVYQSADNERAELAVVAELSAKIEFAVII